MVSLRFVIAVAAVATVLAFGAYVVYAPHAQPVSTVAVVVTPRPSAPPVDIHTLIRQATAGNGDAQCELGKRFESGDGVAKNYVLARAWIERSADQHDACGTNNMGNLYYDGVGVPVDYATALDYYTKAVALGYPNASYNIGNIYYYGSGVPVDVPTGIDWYTKAANLGSTDALAKLGEIYEWGEGVPVNPARANSFLLRADPARDPYVAYDLAALYNAYEEPGAKRCSEVVKLFDLARSIPEAQFIIGREYRIGDCRKTDYRYAAKWFKMAADDGDAQGASAYAELLWDGKLGPPDQKAAVPYIQMAALAGDDTALVDIAEVYDAGISVTRNPLRAREYYEAAAEKGNLQAIGVLENAYQTGFRTKRDPVKAYGLLLVFESLGAQLKPSILANASHGMTTEQLAEAKMFALGFERIIRNNSENEPTISLPPSARTVTE